MQFLNESINLSDLNSYKLLVCLPLSNESNQLVSFFLSNSLKFYHCRYECMNNYLIIDCLKLKLFTMENYFAKFGNYLRGRLFLNIECKLPKYSNLIVDCLHQLIDISLNNLIRYYRNARFFWNRPLINI